MDAIRQTAISLIVVCLIHSILQDLLHSDILKKYIKLLYGTILVTFVLNLFLGMDIELKTPADQNITHEALQYTKSGKEMAQMEQMIIIRERIEAYISNKAEQLGAHIAAEVLLDTEGNPIAAELKGTISEESKSILSDTLAADLNISKENLLWIG